jgi:hypothetical protein
MLIRLCAALSLALGAAACIDETSADTQASSVGSGHHHGPPPQEAFDACAGSTAGDTCAFSIDGHDITGTCKNGPDGTGELACAPDRPPPPPESIDACASSAAGDTCAFSIDGHDITGTCKNGPDGAGPLGCAPDQPPPPPPH